MQREKPLAFGKLECKREVKKRGGENSRSKGLLRGDSAFSASSSKNK